MIVAARNACAPLRFDIYGPNMHYPIMAKTVNVVVTDDIDGTREAQTIAFTFDGQGYEIDLGQKNRAKLEKSLQPYMDAGRRTTAQRKTAKADKPAPGTGPRIDRAAVRAWATSQGLKVSERGRISAEVMSKYEAAR